MITNNKGSPVPPLRDYQQEALVRMQHYEGRAALLVLATGLGKTRIFTEFLRWEVNENDHHCLILSHREELVHQPLTYLQDLTCGVELADKRANHEPIISASVQSLVSRLDKYNPREIDTIIVDEAHHAAAPTYRRILDYFQNAQIFGFSATPHRGDGVGLGCVFEDIIYDKDVLWAIKNNYLAPIKCRQVNLKYDMGKVKIREDTNDYDQTAVARVMSGTAVGVVEAYNKYAKGPTIIFAASLDEVRDITHLINKQSNSKIAAAVTAATPDRDRLLEAYTLGLIKVLVNYSIFTEGTDLPATETIIIARPIAPTNVGLYAQIVGRGLRPYPGKACCNVIDCVGISDYPICTAATLIGDEPKEPQPQKAKQEQMADSEEQIEVLPAEKIPDTWIKKEREVNVMDVGMGADMHDVAWIPLTTGGYLLPIPGVTYKISKPLTDETVFLYKNKKSAKSPMPLQFIFDWVYQDLRQKHANAKYIWCKSERKRWDNQPITHEQITLIKKLAPDYKINTKKTTRGDASAIIQNLLYIRQGGGSNAS